MVRALIFAAALTLSGCIDFVAPEREPPPGGGFAVSLWVTNDSILVVAGLRPGQDVRGAPRQITSQTLRVDGVPIAPEPRDGLVIEYRASLPRVAGTRAIDVNAPMLADVPAFGPYRFTITERDGPGEMTVTRGEPIVLAIRVPENASEPAPTERAWNVSGTGGAVTFNASGRDRPPPAIISIPPELLPASGTYRVVMTDHQVVTQVIIQDVFRAEARLTQQIEWTIQIVPAE